MAEPSNSVTLHFQLVRDPGHLALETLSGPTVPRLSGEVLSTMALLILKHASI